MRNSTITYLLGFFFLISCIKAISKPVYADSSLFLEIDGKVTNATDDDGTCLIELLTSNTVVDFATLKDGKKSFHFILKKNTVYTIKMSKRGYVSRTVCIDTKAAGNTEEEEYGFSFKTRLIREAESDKFNKELLDFPIALIYFDAKKDCFVYDKEYTSRIKREIVMK